MTSIEWTDETWNPVAGCSIVSPGCTNCYAMQMAYRLEAMGKEKYTGLTRLSGDRRVWTGGIREADEHLAIPHRWKKPRRIFVNSMSDVFHPAVSEEFVGRIWQVMRETPRHTYQILSKRPERMKSVVAGFGEPLGNLWLGTSVESAAYADRIDHLRATPAAIRFISFEPLIGPVGRLDLTGIDWAIVGGESGPDARPMHPDWARAIRGQCKDQGAAFFFKQWGSWLPIIDWDLDGEELDTHYEKDSKIKNIFMDMNEIGGQDSYGFHIGSLRLHTFERMSKRAAGRLLDGRTWDEYPVVQR